MSSKEAMDLSGSSRRRGSAPKAGSVWESRMKIDEFKGGFKVFNATHEIPQQIPEIQMDKKVPKQSPTGKRKTWKSEGLEGSPVKIAGLRSELSKNLDESCKELSVASDEIKKSPVLIKKTRSGLANLDLKIKNSSDDKKVVDESRSDGEFDVCEEKEITSNVVQIKNPSLDESDWDDDDDDDDEDVDEKIEVENKRFDVKEVSVEDHKPKKTINLDRFHPTPKKINSSFSGSGNFNGSPITNSKLQSFVDLVMWKDISKSAFVFGIGTFAIISSSYTRDLNISFISVVSYLGLVYLAAIFLFRSFISRGAKDVDNANEDYVVGEDEAIWVVKLFLPYVNEFLVKWRALFSGDPATTMKLAVLLFILARCGSSITLWKMAKLGFIGVFTVPKICSTYSSQLTAYGTFWIRRFGDAWNSCSHKKAVGFATFTLIWNLSSVVARIWAVFMLFVAFKYYQQSLVKDEWAKETSTTSENLSSRRQSIGEQQPGRRFIPTETRKEKKVY